MKDLQKAFRDVINEETPDDASVWEGIPLGEITDQLYNMYKLDLDTMAFMMGYEDDSYCEVIFEG